MDGTMTKAPLGGEATGPNPTDRGELGVKRSLLVDGDGTPLAVAAAANTHEMKLVAETFDTRLRAAPKGVRSNLCMDRGYDFPVTEEPVRACRFRPHIRSRGEVVYHRRSGEVPR